MCIFLFAFYVLAGHLTRDAERPLVAGYGRRSCSDRCPLRDESSESSSSESEECVPHYHGSIPRLIITLDREADQLHEDLSPDTPGCPLELRAPPRPIPVFTFTCEDFDELNPPSDTTTYDSHEPPRVPDPPAAYRPEPPADYRPDAPVAYRPEPPADYRAESPDDYRAEAPAEYRAEPPSPASPASGGREPSSSSGDACLPPVMRPIDTRLTLELFAARREPEPYRGRCTGLHECVSACDCCRTPQPETQPIPYIDEPSEPLIFENDGTPSEVATPKTRRILPSLSLDRPDDARETADAVCQTPSSPLHAEVTPAPVPTPRKLELSLDVRREYRNIDDIHCRLRRALFKMSKSFSSKSEDTEAPSTYSTSGSGGERVPPVETGPKQILDCVDRKSWKSPDEYRPSFGKVKALTKHFNAMNLSYCVKNYKRNCQSSPNLSGRVEKPLKTIDNVQSSASLADIHYESNKTDTTDTRAGKMSDNEVRSILIQLEDWSKYGSRGSEDTLAQGNEFELPNLPSEEHAEANGGFVFNEIIDKKPRVIAVENIKLKSNQSSFSEQRGSRESVGGCSPDATSPGIDCTRVSGAEACGASAQSCPDVSACARGRSACAAASLHHSWPALAASPPATARKTHTPRMI